MNTYDIFASVENTILALRYDGAHQYRTFENDCRVTVEPDSFGELTIIDSTNPGLVGRKLVPDDGTGWKALV